MTFSFDLGKADRQQSQYLSYAQEKFREKVKYLKKIVWYLLICKRRTTRCQGNSFGGPCERKEFRSSISA